MASLVPKQNVCARRIVQGSRLPFHPLPVQPNTFQLDVPGFWSHCNTCLRYNGLCILLLLNPLVCSHKTCYRTCITEDPFFEIEECTACITDVDNEPIEVIAPQDSALQNIFTNRIILSPNFPNELYPDSIQCRYSNKVYYCLLFLF